MTKIYFVRHAKPDFKILDDLTRPLTDEGLKDSESLCELFKNKDINKVYSSPYKRAIDTVLPVAQMLNLEINIVEDFRERRICNKWLDDFDSFAKNQWKDFNYKIEDGECLLEVQQRNINALKNILRENNSNNIIIGTHGTALSTIINYYDVTFKYEHFERIKNIMPWVVMLEFEGENFVKFEYVNN
ncbi:histidine phosphatase family protein [Clostridium senegalense]|uniref:histidine phosphatase family protein n=1 Tax=Clostridium senegalense TaxID=1465809 RepID=UPI0002888446|nr:histidine phosphatase family protein [Clostridium senegalense]